MPASQPTPTPPVYSARRVPVPPDGEYWEVSATDGVETWEVALCDTRDEADELLAAIAAQSAGGAT